ncbi:MAG: iron-dicitrate transporter ATP-binding protein [Phycisphaerales bacterium]|nr:iron-dicitrate transporter ATP-binding protein [Phycisphaerales bacterium]
MSVIASDNFAGPIVSAKGLVVTLASRPILSGIDLTLQPGRVAVLIGPNGGGKTTLLRALLGHVPASGDVTWLGRPLAKWSRRELSRIAAYLPQSPTFEPGDRVIDVLRLGRLPHGGVLGLDSADDDAVLADVAKNLSLTDLLDRPIETLSGGQRQRVFLGRALAQKPKAILLDEPATYLDLRHQIDLYTLLGKLAREQGISVLMASHDVNLSFVHADDAMVLKDGRVLAQGDVEAVMTEATLSSAFDVPIRKIADGERAVFTV